MIVADHQPNRISVTVYGEFTMSDYKEFEELVNYKVKFEGPVDLIFDLRQMGDFTLDVALEELRFSRTHPNDFSRIAVVTDSQWMTWAAWLSQIFVNAETRVCADVDEATLWLDTAA
ncbi:MAG: STAS/SEC14 domain-containing protein [Zoogloeaceae bacterium]|nr:STAS/SEC14 domain-containing protein [Zoogloeaceae bacterium]